MVQDLTDLICRFRPRHGQFVYESHGSAALRVRGVGDEELDRPDDRVHPDDLDRVVGGRS